MAKKGIAIKCVSLPAAQEAEPQERVKHSSALQSGGGLGEEEEGGATRKWKGKVEQTERD